jgi:CRP/FNR family transcriptional regulator
MVITARAPDNVCSSFSPSPLRRLWPSAPQSLSERDGFTIEKMAVGSRRVARAATLYRRHDTMSILYLVRFGQFKLMAGELNEQRVAGLHMTGDLLGMDAIATGRHNFDGVALENSEVYEIPFAAILETMSAEPAFQRHFLRIMSQALIAEYDHSGLGSVSHDRRFASFLVQLGEKYARLGYSDKSYRLNMSRGDIGSYLGIGVETISRLITRFNAQGAVSIKGRMVDVLDRPYLRALACGG